MGETEAAEARKRKETSDGWRVETQVLTATHNKWKSHAGKGGTESSKAQRLERETH